jgi:hypothetical protein
MLLPRIPSGVILEQLIIIEKTLTLIGRELNQKVRLSIVVSAQLEGLSESSTRELILRLPYWTFQKKKIA